MTIQGVRYLSVVIAKRDAKGVVMSGHGNLSFGSEGCEEPFGFRIVGREQ